MSERGNGFLRNLDRLAGIPLTIPAAACRLLDGQRANGPMRKSSDPRRIGVFCPGALGDAILLTALLAGIREQEPTAEIDFIGSAANAAVLPLLPHVSRSWAVPIGRLVPLIRQIRKRQYDVFLDASQWARVGALVSACSGAGLTVGFRTKGQWRALPYDVKVPHSRHCHELRNFLALGQAVWPQMRPSLLPELALSETAADAALPDLAHTIFCHMWPAPGRGRSLKQWPESHWTDLARVLLDRGYRVAFTGSADDASACAAFISRNFPGEVNIGNVAGRLSLAELARCFQNACAVISVNTGIMHLAAACGTPTLGLHGATDPRRWGPVGSQARALLPRCGDFAYLHLGFEYPPGIAPAMQHLPVSDALAALAEFGL